MKTTLLGINTNPHSDSNQVTHEMLASIAARYSRSSEGIGQILEKVDWSDPNKAIERIFRFVDYGHSSIMGLTSAIPIFIDNISMWLIHQMFKNAPIGDGQETSTRYLRLNIDGLRKPEFIGIPHDLKYRWLAHMREAFRMYGRAEDILNQWMEDNPGQLGEYIPSLDQIDGKDEEDKRKKQNRLKRNFVFDRIRYFLPCATASNIVLILNGKEWCSLIRELRSMPVAEANALGDLLAETLAPVLPHLLKHAEAEPSSIAQQVEELLISASEIQEMSHRNKLKATLCHMATDDTKVELSKFQRTLNRPVTTNPFEGKGNRYNRYGWVIRRQTVHTQWRDVAFAELRDLNRHRSGHRFSPMVPTGFYIPTVLWEKDKDEIGRFLDGYADLVHEMSQRALEANRAFHHYGFLLGTQFEWEHTTQLDKMLYEIELRTGMGAHYRYAYHMRCLYGKLRRNMPTLDKYLELGSNKPEVI